MTSSNGNHHNHRPLSIRQALFLSIALTAASTILAAIVLYGHKLQQANKAGQCLRARAVTRTYAVQLKSALADKKHKHLQTQIQNLAKHPDLQMLAVLDNNFNPLAADGETSLLKWFLQPKRSDKLLNGAQSWLAHPQNAAAEPLVFTALPLSSEDQAIKQAVVLSAMSTTTQSFFSSSQEVAYLLILLFVAGFGVALAFWYLKQSVLKPLTDLIRYKKSIPKADAPNHNLERSDEIGNLARVISEMDQNLDLWKKRIGDMEKSVTDRVAARTRQIARQLHQTEQKAWTDPLTGLGNRQLLEDKFADIFSAQKQAGQDLSLVIIDIDNFKVLNDTLGHQAGDRLLQFVGELLSQCLREQDLAIRYGGDEFLLILPGVAADSALHVAQRTIRMFAQQSKLYKVTPRPSMSAGIASLKKHHPATIEQFIDMADRALYATKYAGKSNVSIYDSNYASSA